jgi:hypothetical protein
LTSCASRDGDASLNAAETMAEEEAGRLEGEAQANLASASIALQQ